MISANIRFGSLSFDGLNLVIYQKTSMLGTSTINVPPSRINGVAHGKLGFRERYIRLSVAGEPNVVRRGRAGIVRDPYAFTYWARHDDEVRAVLAAAEISL
jgi:hypothetical protein